MYTIALTPPVFHALLWCQRFCLAAPGPSGAFLSANGHLPALSPTAVLDPAPPYSLGAALETASPPSSFQDSVGSRETEVSVQLLAVKVSSPRLPKRQQRIRSIAMACYVFEHNFSWIRGSGLIFKAVWMLPARLKYMASHVNVPVIKRALPSREIQISEFSKAVAGWSKSMAGYLLLCYCDLCCSHSSWETPRKMWMHWQ